MNRNRRERTAARPKRPVPIALQAQNDECPEACRIHCQHRVKRMTPALVEDGGAKSRNCLEYDDTRADAAHCTACARGI